LLVAGAPVIAFGLTREATRKQIAGDVKAPTPPDVSHPLLRAWLDGARMWSSSTITID
jgi:hypothetical protein